MRSHKWKFFAKMAWFCKCLATRGNQTRARPRYRSKNEAFVISHERKRISPWLTALTKDEQGLVFEHETLFFRQFFQLIEMPVIYSGFKNGKTYTILEVDGVFIELN